MGPTVYLPLPEAMGPSPIRRVRAGVCVPVGCSRRYIVCVGALREPLLLPSLGAAVDVEAVKEILFRLAGIL